MALTIGILVNLGWFVAITMGDNFWNTPSGQKVFNWGWPVSIFYPLHLAESYESFFSALLKFVFDTAVCGLLLVGLIFARRFLSGRDAKGHAHS